MQKCRICNITKPFPGFAKSKKSLTGHEYICKECRKIYHKEYSQRPKTIIESQRCSACNIEKPMSAYSRDKGKKTGYATQCKECSYKKTIVNREKNSQKVSQIEAKLTETDRHNLLQTKTECRTCHIAKPLTEFHRQNGSITGYRHQCKTCRKILEEDYRMNHTTDAVIRMDQWRKSHPEKFHRMAIVQAQRHRARKLGAPIVDLTDEQWQEILLIHHYRCVYCPDDCQECEQRTHKLTQDHLTALSKGGSDTVQNVLPACRSCNSKKQAGEVPIPVQPLLFTLAQPKPKRSFLHA